MTSEHLLNILLAVIGFGVGWGVKLMVGVSRKVNSIDVKLGQHHIKLEHTEKQLGEHKTEINFLKTKIA